MIAASTVMMMILMYLNTYALDHIFRSETRAYMAVLMGAAMAIVMFLFMLGMYPNKIAKIAIFAGAGAVFVVCLLLVRSQTTVGEISWMKALIVDLEGENQSHLSA